MRKLKLFSLALMALFSTSVWGAVLWESDLQETISGVTVTKLNNSDSWATNLSLDWAPGLTKAYSVSGSGRGVQLQFATALSLQTGDVIRVFAGATNNTARTLSLFLNDGGSAVGTVSLPNSGLRVLDYELSSNLTLSKIKITSNNGSTYIFKVVIFRESPTTGETTISYEMTYKGLDVQGRTSNLISTISNLSSEIAETGLTTSTSNGQLCYSGEIKSVPASESSSYYTDLQFKVADGYTFTPSSVVIKWQGKNADHKAKASILDATTTVTSNESSNSSTTFSGLSNAASISFASGAFTGKSFSGTVHIRVYFYGNTASTYLATALSITGTVASSAVANPTITAAVNEDGWGSVEPASITVTNGDMVSISGNVLTCGGETLTATPADADAEYTYAFESWSGISAGAVTTNLTATANFTRTPNTYDVNYTVATNGSYTIKVGEESAVSESTTAAYGQTVTLAATPASGYKLGSWKVCKTNDESTIVTVTSNAFTMPAYDVTISATFVEATILYDCSVMTAENKWLSFTGEEVTEKAEGGKSKTFGTSGNPQLVVTNGGWDKKDNIINSFIKFINGTTSMSIVIPTNRYATVTIKYGSYNANSRYLTVGGVGQTKPAKNMVDGMTAEDYESYLGVVELTDQSGTLSLGSADGNLYIAYVDIALTGYIVPTAISNTEVEVKAVKRIENGLLVIEKDGKTYNVMGARIR